VTSPTDRTSSAGPSSDTARNPRADGASDTDRALGGEVGSDTAHPPGEGRGARLARFEQLLARGERLRARALPFDDLRELARLYRAHAAQLARLRSRSTDPDAIRHLNALCVRAYGFLYSSSRSRANDRPPRSEPSWRARLLATAGARRAAWASWNYYLPAESPERVTVTYHMNRLQQLPTATPVLVTLNREEAIAPDKIVRRFTMAHPIYTRSVFMAQGRWAEINGVNRTYYCGAYWGSGFHEDGVRSAVTVCRHLGQDLL